MAKEKKEISSKVWNNFSSASGTFLKAVDGRSDAKLKKIALEIDALTKKAWKHLIENYYFKN